MNSNRAPKQWSLTKNETITTFEAWRQNLQYSLSLNANFAPFLADTFTWLKKSSTAPTRGLESDGDDVPTTRRHTAFQKNLHLDLMLGQIANFCPVISRSSIVKNSTSISSVWQAIRAHYGFQSTGARFLDFSDIKLEVDERPEDLFQRLMSFTEDNLLVANGPITHHGANVTADCYEAQLLRIIFQVNKRRKLRTLTLIHPVVNPNIHELTYCHNLIHFEHPNLSLLGSASPGFLQTLN